MKLKFSPLFENRPCFIKEKIQYSLYSYLSKTAKEELAARYKAILLDTEEQDISKSIRLVDSFVKPKQFTLRNDKKGRWKVGEMIEFEMDGKLFAPTVPVRNIQHVKLCCEKGMEDDMYIERLFVEVDGLALDAEQIDHFVVADGFQSIEDFILYHFKGTSDSEELFKVLICWTGLRY